MRGGLAALSLLVGWGFVGAGLYSWAARPDNRVGMLMTATGFAWLVAMIGTSDIPLLYSIGGLFSSLYFATAAHMLLAAPDGRLHSVAERRVVLAAYAACLSVIVLLLFVDPERGFDCTECPENALLITHSDLVVDVFSPLLNFVGVVIILLALLNLLRRWRRAVGPERRIYGPLYAAGIALMITLAATLVLQSVSKDSDASEYLWLISLVPLAVMPYVFLFAFVRARMLQGGAVGSLIARLGEAPYAGQLGSAIADALGDPSLELVYWLPDDRRYVDADGRGYELPGPGSGRAVAQVEREGERIAAIVYDSSIEEAGDSVQAMGTAAALVLSNERLDAQLRVKLEELRASRERMLHIGLEERRRLERDLHDGAQQRLVSMALGLRLARSKLHQDPDAAESLLAGASRELEAALAELRELARGIHPAHLSDRGLGPALESLAHRAPVPVELEGVAPGPLPEAVELAAYYVVAEALTNMAKYSRASHASVRVDRENGRVVVAVADDGVGGADPERGTGLRGLSDRIGALEGRLEVDSRPGGGTTVTARIPCG